MTENQRGEWELSAKVKNTDSDKAQQKLLHATIKKVTADIESFSFNTAISQMMIFVNGFTNVETIPLPAMRTFLILLNPFCSPHRLGVVGKVEREIHRCTRRYHGTGLAKL